MNEWLDDFVEYRIYRNGEFIGATPDTVFTGQLPGYGTCENRFTSIYDPEGESIPSVPGAVNRDAVIYSLAGVNGSLWQVGQNPVPSVTLSCMEGCRGTERFALGARLRYLPRHCRFSAGRGMYSVSQSEFLDELAVCAERVRTIVCDHRYQGRFVPDDLRDAVTLYPRSGGKRLRPAILLWSCGVMGGETEIAYPAAAAVELFHTWTLVHDDIIDRDERRRGGPTVHEHFRGLAASRHTGLSDRDARHYGVSVGILSGDVQHGWAISLLTELSKHNGIDPLVTLHLIDRLDNEVLNLLVSGELLDIQFCQRSLDELTLADIEDMLWKKTSVLYRYCAEAGALIGLNRYEPGQEQVRALVEFSSLCGTAFQLQDDILGVIGDPEQTGKPVGNDIREGKRTTLVHYTYAEATPDERRIMAQVLGDTNASPAQVGQVVGIMQRRGGVQRTRQRARAYVEQSWEYLKALPPGRYRSLLAAWAGFLVSREV